MVIPPCEGFWLIGAEVWSPMGVEGVVVPVSATNDKPLQGFSFGSVFPIQHARLAEINLEGTVTEQVGADVFVVEIWNGGPEDPQDALGWGTCSVILDFEPPLEGRVIPPGVGQRIANLVYDILPPVGERPEEHLRSVRRLPR